MQGGTQPRAAFSTAVVPEGALLFSGTTEAAVRRPQPSIHQEDGNR